MAMGGSISTFKAMLDGDWYMNPPHQEDLHGLQNHLEIRELGGFCPNPADTLLLQQPIDSSSSCSPSQAFTLDPLQSQPFLPTKPCLSSLLNVVCNNPFDNGFNFGSEPGFFGQFQGNQSPNLVGFKGLSSQAQMGTPELSSSFDLQATRLLPLPENGTALGGSSGFNPFKPPVSFPLSFFFFVPSSVLSFLLPDRRVL